MCCRQIHVNLSDCATGDGCGGRLNETVFNPVPNREFENNRTLTKGHGTFIGPWAGCISLRKGPSAKHVTPSKASNSLHLQNQGRSENTWAFTYGINVDRNYLGLYLWDTMAYGGPTRESPSQTTDSSSPSEFPSCHWLGTRNDRYHDRTRFGYNVQS
ncbi:hypothetical protein TWF706_010799 [Orbilia oligospora]|nr:hypothetical protein TWF706_010799 [Orbilia oligospora]